MSELRQKFEELPDIKGIIYGSDFGFNESLNQYYHPDHTNHRLNYAFIMGAWCAFQSQQAEIDQLKAELALCREENKGLVEIKDRVRDEQQAQIDELKHQKSLQELAINQISQANQEWQRINSDLQKRVDGVSQVLCELKKSLKDFQEMDLYDKGYRVTTEYVIADLEQALRGTND